MFGKYLITSENVIKYCVKFLGGFGDCLVKFSQIWGREGEGESGIWGNDYNCERVGEFVICFK